MVFKEALTSLSAAILLTLFTASIAIGNGRSVAITVDDLPYAGAVVDFPEYTAEAINSRLLEAFTSHQIPDTYITGFGPMWGYRWAQERKVTVNGRLEPDPPEWVLAYDKQDSTQP